MQCHDFENLLSEYIDGADAPVERAMLEHRQTCERCEQTYRQVRSLVEEMNIFPELSVPETLISSILRRTVGEPKRLSWQFQLDSFFRRLKAPRFVMATALMFVFFSLTLNLVDSGFRALGDGGFRPGQIVQSADSLWQRVYKRWIQLNDTQNQVVAEIRLLKNDLSSRIDYSVLSFLFKRYDDVIEKEAATPPAENKPTETAPKTQEQPAPSNRDRGQAPLVGPETSADCRLQIADWRSNGAATVRERAGTIECTALNLAKNKQDFTNLQHKGETQS